MTLGALDGFTSAKPAAPVKPTATQKVDSAASTTSSKPAKTPESLLLNPEDLEDDDEAAMGGLDAEFSKQLASGMEELMKEMNGNAELQKSFEEMFKGLDVNGKSTAAPTPKAAGAASFQDRIAKTMDKLKDSSEQVDVSVMNGKNTGVMFIILYRNRYMEDDMPITNVDHRELCRQEGYGTTHKDGHHLCTFYTFWLLCLFFCS